MRESLRFALRTPVAALSSVALKLPPSATRSLCPGRGFLVCRNLSSFTAPSPLVQVPSLFFCLCYFFFLLRYPSTWGFSCLLGGLTSSASVQWVFCRSSFTCRCISTVSVGRKVISTSYSSAILPRPPEELLNHIEFCEVTFTFSKKIHMFLFPELKNNLKTPISLTYSKRLVLLVLFNTTSLLPKVLRNLVVLSEL